MPSPMRSGRARISLRHPKAMSECDRCSSWRNLDDLSRQFQWSGNKLIDIGLLVCRDCLDLPQDQFRSPILPADPYPRINPRPSKHITPVPMSLGQPLPTSPENQGFTVYILDPMLLVGIYGYVPPDSRLAPLDQFILDTSVLG